MGCSKIAYVKPTKRHNILMVLKIYDDWYEQNAMTKQLTTNEEGIEDKLIK